MHAGSHAKSVVCSSKVYRCQINRQAFQTVTKNNMHRPEIWIFWFCHNNIILFHSVNYVFLQFTGEQENPLPIVGWGEKNLFLPNVLINVCVQKHETEADKPLGKTRQCASLTQQKQNNLGRETHCDLMNQPEIKTEKEKGERPGALTFKRCTTLQMDSGQRVMKGISSYCPNHPVL